MLNARARIRRLCALMNARRAMLRKMVYGKSIAAPRSERTTQRNVCPQMMAQHEEEWREKEAY